MYRFRLLLPPSRQRFEAVAGFAPLLTFFVNWLGHPLDAGDRSRKRHGNRDHDVKRCFDRGRLRVFEMLCRIYETYLHTCRTNS